MSNAVKVKVGAQLFLSGMPMHIVSLEVRESLSTVNHAHAVVATRTDLDVVGLTGGDAKVMLMVNEIPMRTWSLQVGEVRFQRIEEGSIRYEVDMYSHFWRLQHTKDTRKFRNMSAQDIVTQVLSEGGQDHEWNISRTPPVRKYCVQYRESNFDFVSRLLEFEGIYYVSNDDGTLTMEDTSPSVPTIAGPRQTFVLLEHAGSLEGGELGIHSFGWGCRVGTGKVTVNDFNWKTPNIDLKRTATADLDGEYEWYDYPHGYRKESQGEEFAQIRLEAYRARTTYATGWSNVVFFRPGRRFLFEGQDVTLLDVTHIYEDPAYDNNRTGVFDDDDVPTYRNRFEVIPAGVKYRTPQKTAHPQIDGTHTVMVRGPVGEEIHTDRFGRFRAQFHWDRFATGTDEDSRWLRKAQEGATSINLARVGWEVNVAYIDGDPDRPIGISRAINGEMVPSYTQPGSKQVMTIKTPTYPGKVGYNELKLDDLAGAQNFYVRGELDLFNRVNNDKTETIGNNQTHMIDLQLKHRVENDQTVNIGSNQIQKGGANFELKVHNDRTVTIGGDQKIVAAGSFQVDVGNNQTETVGGMRFSMVGQMAPPPPPKPPSVENAAIGAVKSAAVGVREGGTLQGGVNAMQQNLRAMIPRIPRVNAQSFKALFQGRKNSDATDNFNRTCGALHLAVAGDDINVNAQYVHAELIGGVKLTVVPEGYSQTSGELHALTIGGAMFKKAGEDAGYGAKKTTVTVGGACLFKAGKKLELSSKQVTLKGVAQLQLSSAGLSINMTNGSIGVEGSMRLEAGDKVIVTGADDNITA